MAPSVRPQSGIYKLAVDPTTVNVADVQGDIILGFPKKKEEFVFFVIQDAAKFQEALPRLKITSTADVIEARGKIAEVKQQASGALVPLAFLNIAFSQKGLDALGITDALGDDPFANGQLKFAKDLGDDGKLGPDGFEPSWEAAFKQRTDGVLVVAGESWKSTNITSAEAISTLGDSISVVYKLKGSVRPGDQKGHEHFGWEDGISNPAVQGVGDVNPGQRVVPPGVILCGMTGDPVTDRPDWAFGGSILAFRQLEQLVPEFSKFLIENPIVLPGLTRKQGSELLGARLVGRWKSGAPIQLSPLHDDPELAADPKRNNNFVYPPQTDDEGQTACPFAAHIRKTNPRTDIPDRFVQASSIIRAGIPYGPEVQPTEKEECVSEFERGLAFVSYQSDLTKGFQFIQESWANIPKFPPKSVEPGFDPIIGQANGAARQTLGTQSGSTLTLPQDFVVSRGGEYFFSPSISALKGKFSGQ